MTPAIEFPNAVITQPASIKHPAAARAAGLSWRRRWLAWILAPLVLFVPLLFLPHDLFFGNRDSLFYGNILTLISDSLHSGTLYPRWFASANASMGSPAMMFYAPLAYIATALIEWPLEFLHLNLDAKFILGMYVSQVLGGFTAFLWLRRRFSPRTAFIGSLHYVLLPYKLIYIYVHLNLAQLWALVFLPLWMLSAEELIAGKRIRGAALFALAGAATYYCHPLTVIAFGAVPVCYTLWFGRRHRAVWASLMLACLLMAGLCLPLAWPQHHDLSWISPDGFLAGKLAWRQNLYHIDVLLCAYYGFIAALVALAAKRCRSIVTSGLAGPSLFCSLLIALVAFMNLHLSEFIWAHVTVLQYLQFPAARLHSLALIAVTFLICVWFEHSTEMLKISRRVYRPVAIAIMVAVSLAATVARLEQFYDGKQFASFDIPKVRAARILSPPEYRTRWGCIKGSRVLDLYRTRTVPPPLAAPAGSAVSLEQWNPPQRIAFTADVNASQAAITVRQCYVPAWQAFDSGKPVPLTAAGPDGLISIDLPQGRHHVEIRFTQSPDMAAAQHAAVASLGLCLLLFIGSGRREPYSPPVCE